MRRILDLSARQLSVLNRLSGWPRRLLAVTCLLVAALFAWRDGASPSDGATSSGTTVLVAARPLSAGSTPSASDVRGVRWAAATVPDSALTTVSAVVGHPIGSAMARGEPFTAARMLSTAISSGLSAGQVAVPVTLRDRGQAAILSPGASLDLYASPIASPLTAGQSASAAEPAATDPGAGTTREIASGVRVLAIDGVPDSTATWSRSSDVTIVVAADRRTAARLNAQPTGSVIATLRPP